jgi:hypothetical protein
MQNYVRKIVTHNQTHATHMLHRIEHHNLDIEQKPGAEYAQSMLLMSDECTVSASALSRHLQQPTDIMAGKHLVCQNDFTSNTFVSGSRNHVFNLAV